MERREEEVNSVYIISIAISQSNKIIQRPPIIRFRNFSSCRKHVSKYLFDVWNGQSSILDLCNESNYSDYCFEYSVT